MQLKNLTYCLLLSSTLIGFATSHVAETPEKRFLLVDTHVDTPLHTLDDPLAVFDASSDFEFNVPKAIEGGLTTVFISIYTSARIAEEGGAMANAHRLIDWVEAVDRGSENVVIGTCTTDVRQAFEREELALTLGMENGSALEGDVNNLDQFAERGIRYITLAHSKSNEFSDSSYDTNEQWGGLSEAGKELVVAMNQQGVMIDISHLSDNAAWQVLELSETPVIATHSSLRHFIPDFHRNMSDDMVVALAENGGVIQINFGSGFVKEESRAWSNQRDEALADQLSNDSLSREERIELFQAYQEANPYPFATVSDVADHIDRVVELAGIDYVGLGSDFDGVGDTLPIGLKDASDFPNLVSELRNRGYDDDDLTKVLGENTMRVWEANERYSEQQGFETRCNLSESEA